MITWLRSTFQSREHPKYYWYYFGIKSFAYHKGIKFRGYKISRFCSKIAKLCTCEKSWFIIYFSIFLIVFVSLYQKKTRGESLVKLSKFKSCEIKYPRKIAKTKIRKIRYPQKVKFLQSRNWVPAKSNTFKVAIKNHEWRKIMKRGTE